MTSHPYASSIYAHAFAPEYEPLLLNESQTFVLKRPIPGTSYFDAMGCYPLFTSATGANMEKDFAWLREQGIISLVLVTDPFFHRPLAQLEQTFDTVSAYKRHLLHDFTQDRTYSKHHRDRVRVAEKKLDVKRIALTDHMEEWVNLYQALIEKHGIKGIQAFSQHYFEELAKLEPIMFGAFSNGALVCGHLCIEHEGYAYSHLTASSPEGYRLRATFAVYDHTLRYFRDHGAKAFDLGAGAGLTDVSDGLTQFKHGFSNAETLCYLCGKILDKPQYEALSAGKETVFFPAYRG